MARSPVPANQGSELTEEKERLADLLAAGHKPAEIAKRVHPTDLKKRKALRARIWKMVRRDAHLKQAVAERLHGKMLVGLPDAVDGMNARAARGRPDAIKLLFEASGFHNPRVQHEHSGEININLNMPRPQREAIIEGDITDAELVDD